MAALLAACGERPRDRIVATGTIASRSASVSYRREAGYYTPTTGVQLWYERFGDPSRATVVLLSGSDSQAIYWPDDFIVALLDGGYSVVRYDARDVGLSQWLPFPDGFDPQHWTPAQPPPYGLDADVTDLWSLLDGLDIARTHLIGVSQGGMIAQLAAITAPERAMSLTLLSTTPSNPYDPRLGAVDPQLLAYLIDQYPRVGRMSFLPAFLVRGHALDLETDLLARVAGVTESGRDALRAYVEAAYDRAGINGASSQGFAVASAASRLDRLATIAAPTLIIHGRDDLMVRPGHAVALAESIPGARLIWVDGGHGFPFAMYAAHTDAMLDTLDHGRTRAAAESTRSDTDRSSH